MHKHLCGKRSMGHGACMSDRKANKKQNVWEVPYLPIDPQEPAISGCKTLAAVLQTSFFRIHFALEDIGRHYEAIIRVNSQSGKVGS